MITPAFFVPSECAGNDNWYWYTTSRLLRYHGYCCNEAGVAQVLHGALQYGEQALRPVLPCRSAPLRLNPSFVEDVVVVVVGGGGLLVAILAVAVASEQ